MFNVKRNGASVEITDIPQSIPFSVFKDIADKTEATETLVAYVKDKDCYKVVIRHDSVNMAGSVAWLAIETEQEYEQAMKKAAGIATCFSVCIRI
ncbi:hypothetical protein DRM61_23730 [Salmonella enterica subsp. enterica]|nr:hypothetical protein [Salmonella enterica subsp. enterica serovar Monschaui]EAM6310572.1 hypothetical protein [Salmonella enterica]ECG2185750.1 hypothetical protein [Salmonella enterica subsp. enterica serovar Cerro]EDW4708892.1 hypothetical protein [Salmonella enterica subsp. houtenae]EBS4064552.1 hypothetical protein [Salmonella enterica subsp. enterica serovar Monschaui]